jgi:proteasome inhibitor subunit 1 (PI31)
MSFVGLELCYEAFRSKLKRNADAIVLFVHWYLIKRGFVCIIDGQKTEILPKNWNDDGDNLYVIDYSHESKGYELKVLVSDGSLIINLMRKSNERTANITCNIKDHVTDYRKDFAQVYTNLQDVCESIEREFRALYSEDDSEKAAKNRVDIARTEPAPPRVP